MLHIGRFSGKLIYISFYITQEKVKAVFDNLIQLEHLNIVKFHKYWADVKENRARVRNVTTAKKCAIYGFLFFPIIRFFLLPPSGYFHHRVHVFWEPEAVSKEDKEES